MEKNLRQRSKSKENPHVGGGRRIENLFDVFSLKLISSISSISDSRAMASQTVLKGLKRLCKSIPLATLNQGASLSIRSQIPVASLQIVSQWRDDGHIELTHRFNSDENRPKGNLFLSVSQLQERMTSMGRPAPHVAIDLRKNSAPKDSSSASTDMYQFSASDSSVPISEALGNQELNNGTEKNSEPGVHLSVTVPEKVNLDVRLDQGGNISVPNKVEGDVELSTSDGAITVKKIRGHKVRLESFGKDALVQATGLLEAQELNVRSSGRFRAKQIHGSAIDVRISHPESSSRPFDPLEHDDDAAVIDVSALFVSGQGAATLSMQSAILKRKAVRVKTSHGPVRVSVDGCYQPTETDPHTNEIYPLVELGGVNGNFELVTQNSVMKEGQNWNSCLVHVDSLSPDSVSLLSADVGNVLLTIDRKVESDVRFLSTSSKDCLTEASSMLAEEEDSGLVLEVVRNIPSSPSDSMNFGSEPNIDIATKAFTESHEWSYRSSHIHYVNGWVENNSAEPPSRFDRKVRGETAIGKINIQSAADQALHGFGEKSQDETSKEFPRPLLAVLGTSSIKVETVSWLGAIARRYGLDESGRDLGRQASRKGRPLQPLPKSE